MQPPGDQPRRVYAWDEEMPPLAVRHGHNPVIMENRCRKCEGHGGEVCRRNPNCVNGESRFVNGVPPVKEWEAIW